MSPEPIAADAPARRQIAEELDACLLVEAAAGTGKTTSLVERMVALVRSGRCRVDTLAAVTFTRKAAAEIRARFQRALEAEIDRARERSEQTARARLERALWGQQRCFIGTIHSFCARLLRERPVEAGLDGDFREADEALDHELRTRAWREYVDAQLAADAPMIHELEQLGMSVSRSTSREFSLVRELEETGIELPQLGAAFLDMAEFPDVEEWPVERRPMPELTSARRRLREYLAHLDAIGLSGMAPGNCRLIAKAARLRLASHHVDWSRDADFMDLLAHFDGGDPRIIQKQWKLGKRQALEEKARWSSIRDELARPLLCRWREHRYGAAIRALRPAMDVYERLRREANLLSFQDLLMRARDLLQQSAVRRYFRRRVTHLLVDEFQDTDPLQAELMLLLTADDTEEPSWRRCRPAPGALFVVGDPKQSIYRFRRADMEAYTAVRAMFQSWGRVLELSSNFRSSSPLIDWLNSVFQDQFPEESTTVQASWRPLEYGGASSADEMTFVERPEIDESASPTRAAFQEAEWIAGRIVELLESHPDWTPADFLVLTRKRRQLQVYAAALEAAGLPHQVTGGSELNSSPELRLLHDALTCVLRPHDRVAQLAVLRGPLFGVSDRTLYRWRRESPEPAGGGPLEDAFVPLQDALRRLQDYRQWLAEIPLVGAIERIAGDLGLFARAAAAGGARGGALAKGIELIRSASLDGAASDVLLCLERLTSGVERRDGTSAMPAVELPVRVMNLHQAKGLEAKVVFLANPSDSSHAHLHRRHVDRLKGKPRGYLAIYSRRRPLSSAYRGEFRPQLLACPPAWEEYAAREEAHLQAEERRLMYVAATRAGAKLVLCPRTSHNNPWSLFAGRLPDFPPRPHRPATRLVQRPPAPRSGDPAGGRLNRAARPSYQSSPLKPLTQEAGGGGKLRSESGLRWGAAVHAALEWMMNEPANSSAAIARAALSRSGMDAADAPLLLETLRRVESTPIWRRAIASSPRYCEAPLTTLLPPALADLASSDVPLVVNGVIDLVFREPRGWVVVDYKSDSLSAGDVEAACRRHDGQLRAYATAWEHLSGEPVVERGLLFTSVATYVAR